MSLFTSLTSASRALDAQRYGLDVTGQNIANVNTPGYSRRTIDLAAVAPTAPAAPVEASTSSVSARCATACSRPGSTRKSRRSTVKWRWPEL